MTLKESFLAKRRKVAQDESLKQIKEFPSLIYFSNKQILEAYNEVAKYLDADDELAEFFRKITEEVIAYVLPNLNEEEIRVLAFLAPLTFNVFLDEVYTERALKSIRKKYPTGEAGTERIKPE